MKDSQQIPVHKRRRLCLVIFASIPLALSCIFFLNFQIISKTFTEQHYPQYLSAYIFSNNSYPAAVLKKGYQRLKAVLMPEELPGDVWFAMEDKMEHLMQNPVYREFNISRAEKREHVNMLLLVSSAPKRRKRRQSTRETWWPYCKTTNEVSARCFFITDYLDPSTKQGAALATEQSKYGDLVFQHLKSGMVFGKRYMYHIVWALQKYDFDYFIRMDDDMFLCVDRLMFELPLPPVKFFHWGWVHCTNNIVRPEESIIMLTQDVVVKFLGQHPHQIMCHPWADQMIGTWSEQLHLPKFYHHDSRIHHDPPAEFLPQFTIDGKLESICQNYIAVHGSYPKTMRMLWKHRGSFTFPRGNLLDHSRVCDMPHHYDWRLFAKLWQYEPKRCIDKPTWDMSAHGDMSKSYSGREGT